MEEADVLGDQIIIMSKGRIMAMNNSIALKSKFGAGYRISLITEKQNAEKVKEIISSLIPEAVLEDDSAGALIYQFPKSDPIPAFVKWLESDQTLVKNWGISQATLEEVFLKLVRLGSQKKE
jgi:ABC-type multidrug transport system ATPase subunit